MKQLKVKSDVCSFSYNEIYRLEDKIAQGWYITHLTAFEECCTVILEKSDIHNTDDKIYIPPRKKLTITHSKNQVE